MKIYRCLDDEGKNRATVRQEENSLKSIRLVNPIEKQRVNALSISVGPKLTFYESLNDAQINDSKIYPMGSDIRLRP